MKGHITFRPSQAGIEIIEDYMSKHKPITKSKAVSEIVSLFKAKVPNKITGDLVSCPMRHYPVCDDCSLCEGIILKAPVDSSVCQSCPQYPCETWKNIESERRLKL